MTTEFKPNPVLIEAAKYSRCYIATADNPFRAWICDAIRDLYHTNREQAQALADAVDSVLGDVYGFLPSALYEKNIGPFAGALSWPDGEGRRTVRLWWLDQIIAGKPVPGAEV